MSLIPSNSDDDAFLHEKLLSFGQAARLFPSLHGGKGKTMHPSTLWRWTKIGCKSKTGKRVYLEAYRIGSTNVTSIERLQAFIARINDEGSENDGKKDRDEQDPPLSTGVPITPKPPKSPSTIQIREQQAKEAMDVLKLRGLVE